MSKQLIITLVAVVLITQANLYVKRQRVEAEEKHAAFHNSLTEFFQETGRIREVTNQEALERAKWGHTTWHLSN